MVSWLPLTVAAQLAQSDYPLEASRPVAEDRYGEVRGTPYRYASFRPGALFDVTVRRYEFDSLNFNAFTSQFEYLTDGEVRELAQRKFLRASITDDGGEEHIYGWSINPRFPDKYAELIYRGEFITVTLIYDVVSDEKVVEDVGKTLRLRRFTPKRLYYAFVDGELVVLHLKPRKLATDLGFRREIGQFIREHNLKPERWADLLRILSFADDLYE
jgi:hypothetical protein